MNESALRRISVTTWIAVACIAVGWFGLGTLVATFGPVTQVAHFYDMALLIHDPSWLVLGGFQNSNTFMTVAFGTVCASIAAVPILARLGYMRFAWVLYAAPLVLMVLCGVMLYVKASAAPVEPTGMGKVGEYIARWTNDATSWTGDVVSRHISIGSGGYLAFVASVWLAVQGALDRRAMRQI